MDEVDEPTQQQCRWGERYSCSLVGGCAPHSTEKYEKLNPVGGGEYGNGDGNADELELWIRNVFFVPIIFYLKRRNWGWCQDLLVNFIWKFKISIIFTFIKYQNHIYLGRKDNVWWQLHFNEIFMFLLNWHWNYGIPCEKVVIENRPCLTRISVWV